MINSVEQSIVENSLWTAEDIHKSEPVQRWWDNFGYQVYTDESGISRTCSDAGISPTTSEEIVLTTYSVKLKPTTHQKTVLDEMIRVAKHCYNYCNYLVRQKHVRPNLFELQKYVARTHSRDVPTEMRMSENDDWYFRNKMSKIKTIACKHFCTMHKATRRRMKRTDVELNYKDMSTREGSFGVAKVSVRRLTEKDTTDKDLIAKCLCIMGDNFNKRRRNRERFIRLSKATRQVTTVRTRSDHHEASKWKRIFCTSRDDPKYTRSDQSGHKNAMCGIDPGGRTFATVYDPTNCEAYSVGTEDKKRAVIHRLQRKIDQTQSFIDHLKSKGRNPGGGGLRRTYEEASPGTQNIRRRRSPEAVVSPRQELRPRRSGENRRLGHCTKGRSATAKTE